MGISQRTSGKQGHVPAIHHVDRARGRDFPPRQLRRGGQALGSAEEPAKHELRENESCLAVLLREEDSRTCTWSATDLQVRSGHDEGV